MRPELTTEWQPSKKEYLRVEAEVVKLMSKVHDLERACGSLFALFVFFVVALLVIRFLF